jgi:hypothetical protein
MTLAQMGLLIDGDRRFYDPKATGTPAAEPGTFTDLALFASMKVA